MALATKALSNGQSYGMGAKSIDPGFIFAKKSSSSIIENGTGGDRLQIKKSKWQIALLK